MIGTARALLRALVLCLGLTVAWVQAASAQTLIRDPDIEHALRQLATPILNAAGLNPNRVQVLLIQDSSLNAFVADAGHIMIHTGLMLKLDRAEELQAVLAHEAAHIANGHITRRLSAMRATNTLAGFGLLLSAAVAVASGSAEAGAGLAMGTGSTAMRLLFAHTRAEEASADQAALRYMASAGVDPTAMGDVLEIFRGQEALSIQHQDPYVLTHPLTRDRIRAVEGYATAYADRARDDPAADYWFARAQGKLSAFIRAPGWTLRRVPRSDTTDVAVMQRAIAYHRVPDPDNALRLMRALLAARPNDAYLHELHGQMLLESRQVQAAVGAYKRAVDLASGHPLILASYGRALVALGTEAGARQALGPLEEARARDARDPRMMRDLAVAYARLGNTGMASLATAERYALLGRLKDAAIHAKRAVGLLPTGSPGWNRAQDVLNAAKQAGQ